MVPKLDPTSRLLLAEHLKSMEHRTYLWLHLIFREIYLNFSSNSTLKRIKILIQQLPGSVAEAYENILNRSSDQQVARVILNIVLAARRPLTVHEITTAIAIKRTEQPRSYEDLDLEPEEVRESNLRVICGFFLRINESKIYLIHQTAREFLLKSTSKNGVDSTTLVPNMKWHNSLHIITAEYIVTQVCIKLLHFDVFNKKMPWSCFHGRSNEWQPNFNYFISNFLLLEYASTAWPGHYRVSQHLSTNKEIGLVRSICDVQHAYYEAWFPFFWYSENFGSRPSMTDVTTLAIASALGFTTVVKQILGSSGDGQYGEKTAYEDAMRGEIINETVGYYGNALQAASSGGHLEVVRLLVDKGAEVNALSEYGTALYAASSQGHIEVAKLLQRAGAVDSRRKR